MTHPTRPAGREAQLYTFATTEERSFPRQDPGDNPGAPRFGPRGP